MASNNAEAESDRRKKRAWRKPREPVTPTAPDSGRVQDAPPKPIKIKRGGKSSCMAPSSEPMQLDSKVSDLKTDETLLSCDIDATAKIPLKVQSSENGKSSDSKVGVVDNQGLPLLDIDGSIMEGGGQILRNVMALSCILRRPVHITQIRGRRDNPGLRPQHLTGIELLAELCDGRLEGAGVGSREVTFHPQAISGGDFIANTKTAGSVCLLLQVALPVLLFAQSPSKVTFQGGTDADMAPPINYFTMVFQTIAARFGVKFECQLKRRGFYPKGCGEVVISFTPVEGLSAVEMTDPGTVTKIQLHSFTAGAVHRKASHQMISSAKRVIQQYFSSIEKRGVVFEEKSVQETPDTAFGNSSGIIAIAETSSGCILAASANGQKSEPAERTGRTVGEELVKNLREGGCVDEHLQDQLIVLMALAEGVSRIRTGPLTLHTKTAIHVAEKMTDGKAVFRVEELEGDTNVIHCQGIGFQRQ